MKILFILPVLTDSYTRKRVKMIHNLGVDCSVVGYDREHYDASSWEIETESIGKLAHARLLQRIPIMIKSIFKIRKKIKSHDILYCFNFDILFIGWLSTLFQKNKMKIVYDLADIHKVLGRGGFLSVFLRSIERFLLKRTDIVVVASPAYIDGYFRKIQRADNDFFVIENKMFPKADIPNSNLQIHQQPDSDVLTIGYFGMLRCKKSLTFLNQLVEESNGKIKVEMRGIFLQTEYYKPIIQKNKHIEFKGAFVYPDDLPEMYQPVDLVWAAHVHGITNSKWSISNRFYQACFYKKPLITQKGTQDAKRVKEYDIGLTIDLNDFSYSQKQIQSISNDEIANWKENMKKMPEEVYTYSDEHEQLISLITSVPEKN